MKLSTLALNAIVVVCTVPLYLKIKCGTGHGINHEIGHSTNLVLQLDIKYDYLKAKSISIEVKRKSSSHSKCTMQKASASVEIYASSTNCKPTSTISPLMNYA